MSVSAFLQQSIIAVFVIPISFLVRSVSTLYKHLTGKGHRRFKPGAAALEQHQEKVQRVQAAVREWNALDPVSRPPLRTDRSAAASHSVRVIDKSSARTVAVRDMNAVLELNAEKGTVTVEPFVTVGELTSFLLQHGLMLEATLEMEDATLGGLALSQGMTTHSHRCGYVHDTVVSYEFVMANGEHLRASEEENPDVFRAAPFSHGSFGFLCALELRVVPAGKDLLISYHVCNSVAELQELYRSQIEETDAFFLEAIVYSAKHAVLIRGDLLDEETRTRAKAEGVRLNPQGRWYKKWFFSYVQEQEDGTREFMPMRDYLMRHDRSLCMTMLYVYPAGNNPFLRWFFGWMMPPKVTFLKALRPASAREMTVKEQVYQDLAFPLPELQNMVNYVENHFGLYPLLVYPCKITDRGGYFRLNANRGLRESGEADSSALYLNLGVYGIPLKVKSREAGYNLVREVRGLLGFVRSLGGFQHSYCDVFQTEDEFWQMYDPSLAKKVLSRFGGVPVMDVYKKVQPEVPWQEWSLQ